ncbi:MAG: hypothetical protein AMS27_16880, partial [Bacteroides sp. SM23_62_1]
MKNITTISFPYLLCLCFSLLTFYNSPGQDWIEILKRAASDGATGDQFGHSVSISGNYAIIGAPYEREDTSGSNTLIGAGSAYILYKDMGGTNNWGQVKKIVANDRAEDDYFGYSVSISGDYAIVGAWSKDGETGSSYIFYKDQGGINNWGQVKKIVPSDGDGDEFFGCSVSINGDYAIVGAESEDEEIPGEYTIDDIGSAYIFHKDQGGTDNWGQVKKIVLSDREDEDYFG